MGGNVLHDRDGALADELNNVRIERVEPDGRWLATTTRTDYGISELDVCMREHLSKTR